MNSARTVPAFAMAIAIGLSFSTSAAYAGPRADSGTEHSASAGAAVSDAWITTKVKSELATTKGVKSTEITVRTTNGVVTLTGDLATKTAVRKAVAVAKSVKGVKDVDASGLKATD